MSATDGEYDDLDVIEADLRAREREAHERAASNGAPERVSISKKLAAKLILLGVDIDSVFLRDDRFMFRKEGMDGYNAEIGSLLELLQIERELEDLRILQMRD